MDSSQKTIFRSTTKTTISTPFSSSSNPLSSNVPFLDAIETKQTTPKKPLSRRSHFTKKSTLTQPASTLVLKQQKRTFSFPEKNNPLSFSPTTTPASVPTTPNKSTTSNQPTKKEFIKIKNIQLNQWDNKKNQSTSSNQILKKEVPHTTATQEKVLFKPIQQEKINHFFSKPKKEEKKPFFPNLFANYQNKNNKIPINPIKRPILGFAAISLIVLIVASGTIFISYGLQIKDSVKVKGEKALGSLDNAETALAQWNFEKVDTEIKNANQEMTAAANQLDLLGGNALNIFSALPFFSRLSSGKNLVEAGQKITEASREFIKILAILEKIENPLDSQNDLSLTKLFLNSQNHSNKAKDLLTKAQKNLTKVEINDLPENQREKVTKIKNIIPLVLNSLESIDNNSQIFLEILGHNGPRKYLLVFQNNQEMRATGGFIGSYGIISVANGKIKELFIEGIFNPDGQLKVNVIPPTPIQKISAGWSMHDANWFPHFPTSAKKIAWFYEKTGGPTVDGVIAITPNVMQKMLAVTGPIEMTDYETVITQDNFITEIQTEVETNYDKELNQPKKILSDLAPKIIEEFLDIKSTDHGAAAMRLFSWALEEKYLLLHSSNPDLQKKISSQNWGGEIGQTGKDFLMVINSNINGFKTDGVIDQKIQHAIEIMPDGSIVDTVKIHRRHNGGSTAYTWWNKVNSNYMRVYVPRGSKLLGVHGQTREFNKSPLDYKALQFENDPDVQKQEDSISFDSSSGTRIYEEENKTVFANWVYVSPKEEVTVEYRYLLPFQINWQESTLERFSILYQKQSGSIGSGLSSKIILPKNTSIKWLYPNSTETQEDEILLNTTLNTDQFVGTVLKKLK